MLLPFSVYKYPAFRVCCTPGLWMLIPSAKEDIALSLCKTRTVQNIVFQLWRRHLSHRAFPVTQTDIRGETRGSFWEACPPGGQDGRCDANDCDCSLDATILRLLLRPDEVFLSAYEEGRREKVRQREVRKTW